MSMGCRICRISIVSPVRIWKVAGGRRLRGAAVLALVLLLGCASDGRQAAEAEILRARAAGTRVAVERQAELNAQEIALQATAMPARVAGEVARLEMERQAAAAWGRARVRTIEVGGWAMVGLLVAVAGGLGMVALAVGGAIVRRAGIAGGFVRIGVEASTLQAPLLVTADGWLVDPRTGERARLRDRAGVDRLRLQASARLGAVAIAARAAERIAGARNDRPAEVLPAVAGIVDVEG
jgi:hypothetical protein